MANFEQKWEAIRELGDGGQGRVILVRRADDDSATNSLFSTVVQTTKKMTGDVILEERREAFTRFRNAIIRLIRAEDPQNQAALKVLHKAQDARDADLAKDRIKREIEAMRSVSHPSLLKIVDSDADQEWFVSEYHPLGTLDKRLAHFQGNSLAALLALRPVIAGVAGLHGKGIVHRDIKPNNIFVASDHRLVLGDFGLVFFADRGHTRISDTLQNVGSRDWMPPWAMGMRIDEIKPAFDVFSLGKVLWSMISGKSILQLWYGYRPETTLKSLFPNDPSMDVVGSILAKSVAQYEERCLPHADSLLALIDEAIGRIEGRVEVLSDHVPRKCRVCGTGTYKLRANKDPNQLHNFGLGAGTATTLKLFSCGNCGHVQMFACERDKDPPAWSGPLSFDDV